MTAETSDKSTPHYSCLMLGCPGDHPIRWARCLTRSEIESANRSAKTNAPPGESIGPQTPARPDGDSSMPREGLVSDPRTDHEIREDSERHLRRRAVGPLTSKERVFGPVVYGTLTARDPDNVTKTLWTETGKWVSAEEFERLRALVEKWQRECTGKHGSQSQCVTDETDETISAAEFYRYRRCLYRANGRLIQLGLEPEKLDYPSNGCTCNFANEPDAKTHASYCPALKAVETPALSKRLRDARLDWAMACPCMCKACDEFYEAIRDICSAEKATEVRVQACRPEDRAMLQTEAGQELLKAATEAMRSEKTDSQRLLDAGFKRTRPLPDDDEPSDPRPAVQCARPGCLLEPAHYGPHKYSESENYL